jgi:phosphopantetheinyl transferase (holo-ACP synthase)
VILGIGTDIIEIWRVEGLLDKRNFKDRFFTPTELEYLNNKGLKVQPGIFAQRKLLLRRLGPVFLESGGRM